MDSQVEKKIIFVRGHNVLLDNDLAGLYGVTTFNLNKAVKRNRDRFPEDFCFQLSEKEYRVLIFQFGIPKNRRGGRRFPPYAFTEQGVAMLSSVLRSKRAVMANVAIMRVFVRIRRLMGEHKDLIRRLDELEKKYDLQFKVVFDAIRQLVITPESPRRRIGFHGDAKRSLRSQIVTSKERN